MSKKLLFFLGLAFIPVVLLGYFFPERALDSGRGIFPTIEDANVVVFVQDICPHCDDFKEFAEKNGWNVQYYDVTSTNGQKQFIKLQERAPSLSQGVPTVVIDGKVTQGYEKDETTGQYLLKQLSDCQIRSNAPCQPFEEFLATDVHVTVKSAAEGTCTEDCEVDFDQFVFDLPIVGEVDLLLLSLPALSILLGFLDGFNPCAMWVLITLLTLLINTRDMKKVWVIGGTFLFVSGAVYYVFIAAWLNAFLVIGYNMWLQKIIGLVAIGGGGFYLYEAIGKDPNACHVTNVKSKKRTIEQMQAIMRISVWPAMILGVAILAISVNMIELVCTAGLPAIFTQILAFNDVSTLARYGYMGLFILMYMIDDLVIFAIAVYTLHATGLTKKYARFTLVFGGFLMYALGLLLIFAPESLVFQA